MRRMILVVASAVTLVSVGPAQSVVGRVNDSKQAILDIEDRTNRDIESANWDDLSHYWSDSLVCVDANGEIRTKAEWLSYLKRGAIKYSPSVHHDVLVHIYDDTAVVTGSSATERVENGIASMSPRRFTKIYVQQDGRWQLVLNQITNIAKR